LESPTPGGSGPTRADSADPSIRRVGNHGTAQIDLSLQSRDPPSQPPSQPLPPLSPSEPLSLAAVGAPRRVAADHRRWRRCTPPLSLFSSLSSLRDYTLPINLEDDEDDDDDDDPDPEFIAAARASRRSYAEMVDSDDKNDMGYLYEAMDKTNENLRERNPKAYRQWWAIIDKRWEMTLHHDLHAAGYFFNPRIQYKDNVHNDREVMRGTMNVITRLARIMNERLDAMAEVERYKMKLGIYGGYDMTYAAQRLSLVGRPFEEVVLEIDVNELLNEEHPLHAWVETRAEGDILDFLLDDRLVLEPQEVMGLGVSSRDMRIIQHHPNNNKEAKGKHNNNIGDMKANKGKQGMIGDMGLLIHPFLVP
ncbi:hypothetical protein Taro_050597, partial [Colocasia esculenta]|nr:hypothetical protein [Colocasia esculenta]